METLAALQAEKDLVVKEKVSAVNTVEDLKGQIGQLTIAKDTLEMAKKTLSDEKEDLTCEISRLSDEVSETGWLGEMLPAERMLSRVTLKCTNLLDIFYRCDCASDSTPELREMHYLVLVSACFELYCFFLTIGYTCVG